MKVTFQEIRIIATGPCIANQLRDVNTICRRSWYIATNIWKIYYFKIEVVPFIINLRRQKASEKLPELGQAIRRLVNKAYPKAQLKSEKRFLPNIFLTHW
jgi:hypothetical protein